MIKTKIILFVLTMILLANCTSQLPSEIGNVNTTTPQSIDTLTPNIEPSIIATRTPQLTTQPTPTPTLTWTPLPTLSAQEANAKIKELLETNGGCELPCWWGITPNKTVWTEALHFLSPFIFDLEQSKPYVRVENGKSHTYTEIQYKYDLPGEVSTGRMTLGVKDDIVFGMTVYPPGAEYNYQLSQMLALLGPPKQILISAQSSSPIPELPPTVLVLDYSDIGVWAAYGYIPTRVEENLVICPESSLGKVSIYDNLGGRLRLFDPNMESDQAFSIQEYADIVGGFTAKKLEDVTNMTIETFYNTFIDPKPETCLETPANLWP
jgi:hypothetical protein